MFFFCTANDIKKRLDSVRTQFQRHSKPPKSGAASKKKTKRQDWILRSLDFLKPHTTKRSAKSNDAVIFSWLLFYGTIHNIISCRTNTSDESKSERIRQQQAHLDKVVIAGSLYQEMVRPSKVSVQAFRLGEPALRDITVPYSFDYAQQVHYPFNPSSLSPCISCALGSLVCSGSLVKGCPSKWHIWSMRQWR